MPFKIEHNYLYGWDDASWVVDEIPMRFDTQAAAQEEIDEFVEDMKTAYIAGYVTTLEQSSNYRVVST